jgi:hypothetical protein
MGRKAKNLYYDVSHNIVRDLSQNELQEIKQNKNKYLHDALNGIFVDEEEREWNCKNKQYMIRVVEIYNTCRISLCANYLNKHIMYMYIMDRQFDDDKIVVKIGYTYMLYKRNKSLCDDFKCELYLIGVKEVNSEGDEKHFHEFMKQMKKECIYPHKKTVKNNKTNEVTEVNKFELYILCDEVINEFNNSTGVMGLKELADMSSRIGYESEFLLPLLQQAFKFGGDESVVKTFKKITNLQITPIIKGKYIISYS